MTPRVTYDGDIILDITRREQRARPGQRTSPGRTCRRSSRARCTTKLRLRDGESNLLAGLLREDERQSLTGFPGRHAPADREAAVLGQRQHDPADRHRDAADAAHHPHARAARAGPEPDLHRHAEQHVADRSAGDDWRRRAEPPEPPPQPRRGAAPTLGTPTAPTAAPVAPAAAPQPATQPPAAPVLPTGSAQRRWCRRAARRFRA